MSLWIENRLYALSPESMELVIQNKIPGIIIENFISREKCEQVAERLKALHFHNYDHLNNIPVHQLGVCHNQFVNHEKSLYFDKKIEADRLVREVFDGIVENPVQTLIQQINQKTSRRAQVFEEEAFGKYFAGAFRSFSGHGRLHVDHAPTHIKTDWAVTKISKQLTWNIYFSMLNTGGELVIYDTVHTAENELKKVPNEYYFPYSVLENERSFKIRPNVGDLIIFNTQNFHEILGNTDGRRISQTSFMGVKNDGSLNLWS